jgi:hypothetical protein
MQHRVSKIGHVEWDSEEMNSPLGLPDSDDDRRVAWELRCGFGVPAWALTDPRMDAADKLVCAALDRLVGTSSVVKATRGDIEELLRLMPGELEGRLCAPLSKLERLGIATAIRSGGWLLRRDAAVSVEQEPDECSNEGIARWYETLAPREQEVVMATLAEVTRRMGAE